MASNGVENGARSAQVVRSVDFGSHQQEQGAASDVTRGRYQVRDLASGDTWTFEAASAADALAQYLDQVKSNLLVWEEPRCEECGRVTGLGVSAEHGSECSLHPANCVEV